MIKEIWMPHPGHFICGFDCRFILNTYINGVIVSTVGEYFPDAPIREINAKSAGIVLKGQGDERKYDYMKRIGFEEIGYDRKYETMVFNARKSKSKCCPYEIIVSEELDDFGSYNTPEDAFAGHYKILNKYRNKPAPDGNDGEL